MSEPTSNDSSNPPELVAGEPAQVQSTEEEVELPINPGRVSFGLSRIGYNPTTALCDIIDNSVRAGSKNINILIIKERPELSDRRKDNVKEYVVIDDGSGMDDAGIQNALTLGSPEDNYEEHSLSKFGLGLKSAAFSQGEELQVISSNGNAPFIKYCVSLPDIQARGKYFARRAPLSEEDQTLISTYLPENRGTIVRVAQVRKGNHPAVSKTHEELMDMVGVIYYYFIKEQDIHISIDGTPLGAIDVLFTDEANANGNLDENEWNGREVRWIERPKEVILDADADIKAQIEVTQLPHPPTFENDERGKRDAIRKQYRIEAGNYGYYVYRNKRLINVHGAESFGIIPQNQDLYAFRGRILIDDTADEIFNIDVKKSTITLSDDAYNAIDLLSDAYKRKSNRAWNRAKQLKNEREGDDPNLVANEIVADFEPPEVLPGDPVQTPAQEEEVNKREQEVSDEMQSRLLKAAVKRKTEEEGTLVTEEQVDQTDIAATLKGDTNPAATKIYRVNAVDDNSLWEPYFDAESGVCVRINKLHRFARQIYEENSGNTDLQIMFELLLLQMAEAEIYVQKRELSLTRPQIEKLLGEYRRISSDFLAAMCRRLENRLPPRSQQS